jgi:DNA-binding NarL/FixJ family response regulator
MKPTRIVLADDHALVRAGLVSAFVTKPFRHDELLTAVHAVLTIGQGSTHLVSAP